VIGVLDSLRVHRIIASDEMDEALLKFALGVIETEAAAVKAMAGAIDASFGRAVELIEKCEASVLTSGIGKAGHVARKVSATLASTGTPSHFLSPTDAVHGDLGAVRKGDVVLIFSASGESDEILRLLNIVKKLDHPVIAITASRTSALGKFADVSITIGRITEACPLGLAPSASTTAMLALGDALALTVMKRRRFTADDFSIFHPAGQIGRKLTKVGEAMTFHRDHNLPLSSDQLTVGEVLNARTALGERLDEREKRLRLPGAIILFDQATQKLSGIFTDGDLRRLVASSKNGAVDLNRPISDVMTRNPKHIRADALASEAMAMMRPLRIDELAVIDDAQKPIGLIDIQDLVVLKMLDVESDA
jgi:arabinose-5-phosphate isomerase